MSGRRRRARDDDDGEPGPANSPRRRRARPTEEEEEEELIQWARDASTGLELQRRGTRSRPSQREEWGFLAARPAESGGPLAGRTPARFVTRRRDNTARLAERLAEEVALQAEVGRWVEPNVRFAGEVRARTLNAALQRADRYGLSPPPEADVGAHELLWTETRRLPTIANARTRLDALAREIEERNARWAREDREHR